MNISLTPHLEKLVKSKVTSGAYGSASEVIREALRLLEEQDHIRALRLEQLRAEIQQGFDSGPARPLDMEGVKARGRQRLAAEKEGASN